MSSPAEDLLDRAVVIVESRDFASNPFLLLSSLMREAGEEADLDTHRQAYFAVRKVCPETLTGWWVRCKPSKADVLKLFQDALWGLQLGDLT